MDHHHLVGSDPGDFHCRFVELEIDMKGRVDLPNHGEFALIEIGEAKVKVDFTKVSD